MEASGTICIDNCTVRGTMHWPVSPAPCWKVCEELGAHWQARDAAQSIAHFTPCHLPERVGFGR
jgi:hypothetical protein